MSHSEQNGTKRLVRGVVQDASKHPEYGMAEVTLTVECDDGETFEETYDCMLNTGRQAKFKRFYGSRVKSAEGAEVNVVPGDESNPRHILLSELPLKTLGGDVVIPEDMAQPVAMR